MKIKVKGILFASQSYSILDEKTGVVNKGVSIQYITSDDLSPCVDGDLKGIRVSKEWLPIELEEKITVAPAYYEFSMVATTNAKGKSSLSLKDLKFIGEIVTK